MSATTFTPPANGDVWDLRQQILMLQEVALRLFDAQDWWGAYKALTRVEFVTRRLSSRDNPFIAAALLGGEGERTPAIAPVTRPAPPPPGPTLDGRAITPEEAHAHFTKALRDLNDKRARARQPLVGVGKMLNWYARHHGRPFADAVRAVEARARPAPSG